MNNKLLENLIKRKEELMTKFEELNNEEKKLLIKVSKISYERINICHEIEELNKEVCVKTKEEE